MTRGSIGFPPRFIGVVLAGPIPASGILIAFYPRAIMENRSGGIGPLGGLGLGIAGDWVELWLPIAGEAIVSFWGKFWGVPFLNNDLWQGGQANWLASSSKMFRN